MFNGKISDVTKINETSRVIDGKIRYLDTGNITSGTIINTQSYNNIDAAPSRARRTVRQNDIIYSTVRPNQKHYGFISCKNKDMVVSTGFAVITANPSIVNPKYLYYFLSQDCIIDYLQSIAEQSTSAYPSIVADDIRNLDFCCPDLNIQNQIVSILDSINNKTTINTKINDYLVA